MDSHSKRSHTAEGAAAMRAIGARESDAALRNPDDLAERFLGGWMRRTVALPPARAVALRITNRLMPGVYPYITARTKYFDAALCREVAAGAEQVVILGAGADSRAHRFADRLAETLVFELDHPATSEWKRAAVSRLDLAGTVSYVPVEFGETSLAETFETHKVSREKPTLFLWEGVTPYLDAAAVSATLTELSGFAAGSSVVFDYIFESTLGDVPPGSDEAKYQSYLSRRGEPLTFGLDPERPGEYLAGFGLTLADHALPADLKREQLAGRREPMTFSAIVHARVG